MAKRSGEDRKRRGGGGRPPSGKSRAGRKGRNTHARGSSESGKRPAAKAGRRSRSPRSPSTGREALVLEIQPPGIQGQIVQAEDLEGVRWRIECLGDALEVGARIAFLPLGSPEDRRGEMVRLIDSKRSSWVCTLRRNARGLSLTPYGGVDAPEFLLADQNSKGAESGTRVLVTSLSESRRRSSARSTKNPGRGRAAPTRVRVVRILGAASEPDADHAAVVWKFRLASEFSRRARLEVDAIPDSIETAEFGRRLDLRHLPFITIDPATARDHDDAVFAERRSNLSSGDETHPGPRNLKWTHRLWVAIADVSHFVQPGGWIDAEARRRGNSFYFPDRSIPMLPERLSSDLCSLRAGVDRLVIVAELYLGAAGEVIDALFSEAVIRSRVGLAYEDAAQWLIDRESKGAAKGGREGEEWAESLASLAEIGALLAQVRSKAGALALELPEIEIEIDEEGRAINARVRERNQAHRLIEEAMLCANCAVAKALDSSEHEALHRSHPPPGGPKLAALSTLLERLGIEVSGKLEEPGVLANLLIQAKGTPSEERIHIAVLRSMSQARYEAESKGHFALQFRHYTHFTSPIRRYADLEVHRALRHLIRGVKAGSDSSAPSPTAERIAIWLSGRERVAVEVEREADALACCALMKGREGEAFASKVTGVTEFGCFIRLDSPCVSGLIPMRALDGYWNFEPEEEALVGERSGQRIGLGDAIEVELSEIDCDQARMSFRPVRRGLKAGRSGSSSRPHSGRRRS